MSMEGPRTRMKVWSVPKGYLEEMELIVRVGWRREI